MADNVDEFFITFLCALGITWMSWAILYFLLALTLWGMTYDEALESTYRKFNEL